MRLRHLTIFSLLIGISAWGGPSLPLRAAESPISVDEAYPAGDVWVHVGHRHGRRVETLLVRVKSRVYFLPDERVEDYNQDDDAYAHDFYLSPDQRWLFVTRKLYHTVDVAYLYHRAGSEGFVRVRPHGLRFDEAAVRFFSRRLHLGLPSLGAGARVTDFEGWTSSSGLLFNFSADRYQAGKHPGVTIQARYDLHTGQFGLINKTWSGFGSDL